MSNIFFNDVFHPSDFSQGDMGAFAHALRIALAAKGKLSLLHVKGEGEEGHWSQFPSVRQVLANWGLVPAGARPEALHQLGFDVKKVQRTGENTVQAMSDYIVDCNPDLLVLATHQRQGLGRLLHPSIAESTAQKTKVMTLFVPRQVPGFVSAETGTMRLGNILLPLDHSPNPQRALDAACALVRTLNANEVHFTLLFIGEKGDEPSVRLPERPGWTFEQDIWSGDVVDHILRVSEAQDCDLIVMGTRGHRGVLGALRGSTTERVLRGAKCPVLAVPDQELA